LLQVFYFGSVYGCYYAIFWFEDKKNSFFEDEKKCLTVFNILVVIATYVIEISTLAIFCLPEKPEN
jgi:hypothetical protein